MPQRETYRNALQEALAISGSEVNLCVRLCVTTGTLTAWLNGSVPIPDSIFLDAVDIITVAKLRSESPLIDIKNPKTG